MFLLLFILKINYMIVNCTNRTELFHFHTFLTKVFHEILKNKPDFPSSNSFRIIPLCFVCLHFLVGYLHNSYILKCAILLFSFRFFFRFFSLVIPISYTFHHSSLLMSHTFKLIFTLS